MAEVKLASVNGVKAVVNSTLACAQHPSHLNVIHNTGILQVVCLGRSGPSSLHLQSCARRKGAQRFPVNPIHNSEIHKFDFAVPRAARDCMCDAVLVALFSWRLWHDRLS